jgi:pimeloyl-ACP methyl ester carboxylesterase
MFPGLGLALAGSISYAPGPGNSSHQELFQSENTGVRRRRGRGGTAIVTFGSYTNEPTLDRPGFGENFFRRERLDATHVINRCNRWYQHPERDEALAAVAAAVRDYDRAITYGSSMGGYAALRYAVACEADTTIAISPQFTVDPGVVPWEVRWQPDVARTYFAEPRFAPAARQYVFYDPRMPADNRHADLIAATGDTIRIPVPYGGHPVAALLAETGVLQSAIRGIVASDLDPRPCARRCGANALPRRTNIRARQSLRAAPSLHRCPVARTRRTDPTRIAYRERARRAARPAPPA